MDLVLLVDVYHEFEFPYEMMSSHLPGAEANRAVVFVEYPGGGSERADQAGPQNDGSSGPERDGGPAPALD